MDKWQVHKDGNRYHFHSKAGDTGNSGIRTIAIYVFDIPENRRTEVHAKARNLETYQKILDAGKQHAIEKNESFPAAKNRTYYFDSGYSSFEHMSQSNREAFFSKPYVMGSFLERSLSHHEAFGKDDAHGCARNIEESLSVLAKVDENVAEIIDYMNTEIAPRGSFALK